MQCDGKAQPGACKTCSDGFYLSPTGNPKRCIPCKGFPYYCQVCNPTTGLCAKCADQYRVNPKATGTTNGCERCAQNNCLNCDTSRTTCDRCRSTDVAGGDYYGWDAQLKQCKDVSTGVACVAHHMKRTVGCCRTE